MVGIKKRILIADDEPNLTFLFGEILESENIEVVQVPDGKAALDAAFKGHLDLVVLDIVMPGIYGTEVCEKLRKNELTAHLPVFLISTPDKLEKAGNSCGANGFIHKPFSPKNLKIFISNILFGDEAYPLDPEIKDMGLYK